MKALVDIVAEGHNSNASAFAGGGGGSQQVFVQQTRPAVPGPWIWYETDASGNVIDLTINDGN